MQEQKAEQLLLGCLLGDTRPLPSPGVRCPTRLLHEEMEVEEAAVPSRLLN